MKNKKRIFAALLAGTMLISSSMTVMAADGGQIDADVSVTNDIVRVEVPTEMAFVIDRFETGTAGVQIVSGEFDMVNKSVMPVKIAVTSTATLGEDVALAATKAAATESTAATGTAWLAAVAATAEDTYGDLATLTEASVNVATFDTDSKAVTQDFYLQKASTESYKLLYIANGSNTTAPTYAKFYALTEAISVNSDATLNAAVASSDVYVVATSDVATNAAVVTKIAKGASASYAAENKYYTAAAANTDAGSVSEDTMYVYGEMTTADEAGEASFKYIGKLNDAKEAWTTTDISAVQIVYTITGVTGSAYEAVASDLAYGYKMANQAPAFTSSATNVIAFTDGLGSTALAASNAITKVEGQWDGEYYDITTDASVDYSAKTITLANCGSGELSVRITYTSANGKTDNTAIVTVTTE